MANVTSRRLTRWIARVAVAALGLAAVAVVDTSSANAATELIRLSLNGPPGGQPDSGPWRQGCFPNAAISSSRACIGSAGGGSVSPAGGSGPGSSQALAYSRTGRVVLTMPHAPRYNPGTADFLVSAQVRISRNQVTHGANLVQKGYFDTPGGQWKLQADRGVPSCRIAGFRGNHRVSALVSWRGTIVDQGWTRLRCWRQGAMLVLQVGDATPVASPHDARMRIANGNPVSIGGKGTGIRNDQFRGALDQVQFVVASGSG